MTDWAWVLLGVAWAGLIASWVAVYLAWRQRRRERAWSRW